MNISLVYSAVPGFEHKLGKITKVFRDTLSELSVTVTEHNLALIGLPPFDGSFANAAGPLLDSFTDAKCVVVASVAHMGHVNALTQNFAEHLSGQKLRAALSGKVFFSIVASPDGSELAACAYLSGLYASLAGFDGGRMAIGRGYGQTLDSEETKLMIERQTEDLYRQLSQNRKLFIPETGVIGAIKEEGGQTRKKRRGKNRGETPPEQAAVIKEQTAPERPQANEFIPLYNNNKKYSDEEEAQIAEISEFLAKSAPKRNARASGGRQTNCRNLTKSLTHSFQPMNAGGLDSVFQISISGDEIFDCHFKVSGGACSYGEGGAASPDIVIMAASDVWTELLNGKMTCQRAFMGGKIKVRGNFMLLSKFDQMFDIAR